METEFKKIFKIGAEGGDESIYRLPNGKIGKSLNPIDSDNLSGVSGNYEEYDTWEEYWNDFKIINNNWFNFFLIEANLPKDKLYQIVLDLSAFTDKLEKYQKVNWYEKLGLKINENEILFSNAILSVLNSENELLRKKCNKGIFEMPELTLNYEAGKQIAFELKSANSEFENIEWFREYKCEVGFIDLVITEKNTILFAFEFKLDNKYDAYILDIQKLQKMTEIKNKYFCSVKLLEKQSYFKKFLNDFTQEMDRQNIKNIDLLDLNIISTIHPSRNNPDEIFAFYTFWKIQ